MASIVPSLISGGSSLLSGIFGGKGASKAAKQEIKYQQQALAQQQAQFNQTQANEAPFLGLGTSALGPLGNLYGLNGSDAQQAAIDALKASPAFTSQYGTGVDTILQNAAATGGLRGGNVNSSLANFGSGLLNTVIQQQLSGLGGLASLGANTASGLGQLGQQNSNAQTQIYGNIGNANATRAIAPYYAAQSAIGGLNGIFGQGGSFKW